MFVISAVSSALTAIYLLLWLGVAGSGQEFAGLVLVTALVALMIGALVTSCFARHYTATLMCTLAGHLSFAAGLLAFLLAGDEAFAGPAMQGVLMRMVGAGGVLGMLCFAAVAAHTARERGSKAPALLLGIASVPALSVGIFLWLGVHRVRKEPVWGR